MSEMNPDDMDATAAPAEGGLASANLVQRDTPTPHEARAALVTQWGRRVKDAKEHWDGVLSRMRSDQQFARGNQWVDEDGAYVANVTLRHVQSKTDAVYAKNPRHVFRQVDKVRNRLWDGTLESLAAARTAIALGSQAMTANMPLPPGSAEAMQQALAVTQEAAQIQQEREQMRRMGRTLELLYEHQLREQGVDFKTMAKRTVRRAFTTGVGYIKIGYQRVMQSRPETADAIVDITRRLEQIERRSADLADGEIEADSAEAETLRLQLRDLEAQPQILVREGLTFDYPASTAIIPDPNLTFLPEFIGAEWVAEEFDLTPERVQEIYGVDVGRSFTAYERDKPSIGADPEQSLTRTAVRVMEQRDRDRAGAPGLDDSDEHVKGLARVWEIWSKVDGMIYVVCDGYPDFLVEPGSPDVWTERFYPWFVYAPNTTEDETNPFPPSDVTLIRDPQTELNRSREGLREHRHAARPKTISTKPLSDEDRDKLRDHPRNAILELDAVQPGEKVSDVLQAWSGPGVDPNLYEVGPTFQDFLRVGGAQEANLGTTSNATATESAIANDSRMATTSSAVDDFETMLTQIARTGSQILLLNMPIEKVVTIVGPGAIWPELDREKVAEELFLTVKAGSMGRPNQSQEVQIRERLLPYLLQVPGLKPTWLLEDLLRVMDEHTLVEDAIDLTQMSIQTLNAIAQANATAPQSPQVGDPQSDPRAQGPAGADNAQRPDGRQPGGPPAQQTSATAADGTALPVS